MTRTSNRWGKSSATHGSFDPPRRVEILQSDGANPYFKRGQFAYVVAWNTHGGMHFVNKPYDGGAGVSKPGEMAYLVSKSKGGRGGALWVSVDGLRFTGRPRK